jgi:malate synthase
MTVTYEKVASYTVASSGSISTFTLSSIPATYTDLVLICISEATPGPEIWMRLNSDTGSNYSRTLVTGNGTSSISNRTSNATKVFLNDGVTANVASNQIVNIMNYSNTTTYKTIISRSDSTTDAAQALVNLWRSTSAINSITILFDRASTFNAGSTFTLYGIKAE